jgi:hypothetical protein
MQPINGIVVRYAIKYIMALKMRVPRGGKGEYATRRSVGIADMNDEAYMSSGPLKSTLTPNLLEANHKL